MAESLPSFLTLFGHRGTGELPSSDAYHCHTRHVLCPQDYTQNFVPSELKYQTTKALYFERHALYNSEYEKYFDKVSAVRRDLDDYKKEVCRWTHWRTVLLGS